MNDNRPIGLFDSGVGGLSVLLEIQKALPKESYVFLADQGHNPYGSKTKKQLENLSEKITRFLLKHDIKLLVVACNTATCYALDYLRSKFAIPIIGVVPAIKPAVNLTKNGKIAIMSTPATAKSAYLDDLAKTYAVNMQVLKLGCAGLEESVEYWKIEDIAKLLDKYTQAIKKFEADVIVLGCTHFPFLKAGIKKRLNNRVKIIDSGKAIAKRVTSILEKANSLSSKRTEDQFFTTLDPQKFANVASKLLKYKVRGQFAQI